MNKQTLEEFIKSRLTAEQFEKLPTLLQISQNKLTRILNKPQGATLEEVLDIAALLRIDARLLVQTFEMGFDNITLHENRAIIERIPKVA